MPPPSDPPRAGGAAADPLPPWGALVASLVADPAWFDAVVDTVTEAIHRRVPDLGGDADLQRATRESVADNLRLFGAIGERRVDPARIDLPALAVEYARRLAHRGVPLDALLRTYQTAHATVWHIWVGLVRERLDDPALVGQALAESAEAMFAFIELLSDRARDVFHEERERWTRSSAAVRAETVRALLDGGAIDLTTAGGRLRYDLRRHHVAVVAWPAGREDATQGSATLERALMAALTGLGTGTPLVVALEGAAAFGWVGSSAAPDEPALLAAIAARAGHGPRLAIGTAGRDLDGFRRSHREALHARRVAELHGGDRAVWPYGEIAVEALASVELDGARALVRRRLGPLLALPDRDELLRTAHVHLEEQSRPRRAALRLDLHENTVANRVRRIERALGHPLDAHPTEILLACRLAPLVLGDRSR